MCGILLGLSLLLIVAGIPAMAETLTGKVVWVCMCMIAIR